MSHFTVEVLDEQNIIEISAISTAERDNLEISTTTDSIVQILTDSTAGVVYAADIVNLDEYIQNFLDVAEIDCGTP